MIVDVACTTLRHTTKFTYSHANTPLGQSERAYYLSYFITNFSVSLPEVAGSGVVVVLGFGSVEIVLPPSVTSAKK